MISSVNNVPYLYQLQPLKLATIQQQTTTPPPIPNMNNGEFVHLYHFPTPNGGQGIFTPYPATVGNSDQNVAVNSLLFNVGGDPNNVGLNNFALNSAGEITGYTAYWGAGDYSQVALCTLNVPAAGKYTILINHDDGMFFGISSPAKPVSGPNLTFHSLTAMNGYPVMGGIDQNGFYSDSYVVDFPTAGNYNMEIDYFQWKNEQTLAVQINGYSPIPLATSTTPETMATGPASWPVWGVGFAPGYPSVTESKACPPPSCPYGTYAPTGGAMIWSNIGLTADYTWQANMSFTTANTAIIDSNGNQQAPYRTGYSGTTPPMWKTSSNQLTYDKLNLIWILQTLNPPVFSGLTKTFTYTTDTGVLQSVTDYNGGQTTFSNFTCGNFLPQQTTLPLNAAGVALFSTASWNCANAVQTSANDLNGNPSSWQYYDPLWRLSQHTDQSGNQTNYTYTANSVESKLSFNSGTSITDQTTYYDGFLRPYLNQAAEGPTPPISYDTVETDYDTDGRVSKKTLPFVTTQTGQNAKNPNAPGITYEYDAASRPIQIANTASPQGYTNYSYIGADVFSEVLPAPQNEKSKQRQLEYDGLGRLTSVCEIPQDSTGSGCNQSNPQTGYVTHYAYDSLSDLVQVVQNGALTGSGPNVAGAGADVPGSAPGVVWANVQNVESTTNYATATFSTVGTNDLTDWLQATQFGFNLNPQTSRVAGIQVQLNAFTTTASSGTLTLYLLNNGTVVGSPHQTALLSTSPQNLTLGGASDLWGTTWSGFGVNNSSFGVSIVGQATSGTVFNVNDVRVIVSFTNGATMQLRSFSYDMAGRMLSENNAESGLVSYGYDQATSPCQSYASLGDAVQKTDAMGNVTCLTYDLQHRLTGKNYPAGPYSPVTPGKVFVYDSAAVNGIGMSNAAGKIAEEFTCTSCPNGVITDEGFSYDNLGEPVLFLESPQSGNPYYETTETYFPNGAVATIALVRPAGDGTSPIFTYSPDGEGRIDNVQQNFGSGNSLVANATYLSGTTIVNGLTYSSTDSDAYQFDPQTDRMQRFTMSLEGASGGSKVGTLTWNANATLQSLATTNNIPGGISVPLCQYLYDGLSRLTTDNCNNNYINSTTSYDPFGNANFGGTFPEGWAMTFNSPTDQVATFPNAGTNENSLATYDPNGNMTQFMTNQSGNFTWDADGNVLNSGSPRAYDAFDRQIQIGTAPPYANYMLYLPDGQYFALMDDLSTYFWAVQWLYLPLPGGAQAVYREEGNSSGFTSPMYFRHPDFRGSHTLETCGGGQNCQVGTLYGDQFLTAFGNMAQQAGTDGGTFEGITSDFSAGEGFVNFPTRDYTLLMGRFMRPDRLGIESVDLSNPQTWNQYAFVINNPFTFVDPTGTECIWDDGSYDSADDPVTGDAGGCAENGGTWVDPLVFQEEGLADWSPDPNASIANYALNFTTTVTADNNDPQTGVPADPCASAGSAPNPSSYVAQVQQAGKQFPGGPFNSANSLMNQLNQFTTLLNFHTGRSLDAQALGGSRAYGNYVFGAALGGAGYSLPFTLFAANTYAFVKNASYPGFTMDPNYPAIPQANVANIVNGYNAQNNGTLCHK